MSASIPPINPLHDLRLLVYLFLSLRVLLLVSYPPQLLPPGQGAVAVETGLTRLGDFREHYTLATQTNADFLPYRDYWVEFPPVWPVLVHGLYALTQARTGDFTSWASLLYLILLAVDLGNLLWVRHLGGVLHGPGVGAALAWVYALLAAPWVMLAWNFEALVLFCLLAGWAWARQGRASLAGGVLALGILAKYVPLLALPLLWRYRPRRVAAVVTGVALGGPGWCCWGWWPGVANWP
ncbi:MAG: hypothetical protein HC915_19895 [Anaerolineae bacterium]|nr:hypothetical protein [Anaerolineae bacterium]